MPSKKKGPAQPKVMMPDNKKMKIKNRPPRQGPGSQVRNQMAPVAIGATVRTVPARTSGVAQKLADFDNSDSQRVVGSCIFSSPISTYSSSTGGFNAGGAFASLSPATFDTRLKTMSSLFRNYAFRKVVVTYVPAVSTATSGAFAIGFDENYDAEADDAADNTFSKIMDLKSKMLVPVWGSGQFLIEHRGTRLWETDDGIGDSEHDYQGALVAQFNATAGSTVTMGYLHLEYVIDFYGAGPTEATVSYNLSPKSLSRKLKILEEKLKELSFRNDDLVSISSSKSIRAGGRN